MPTAKVDTLKVPGATLHYEIHGSGPLLLMIGGAPADAAMFGGLIELLADRYTVVTFDLRGLSRSSLDGPPEDQHVPVQADDAHHLLAALGTEPAYVLGVSGGALTGLDLAARYPAQVRALVAHEPPAVQALPDRERWLAFFQEVYEIYQADGVGAAMQRFGEGTGLSGPPQSEPSPEMMQMMGRMGENMPFFLTNVLRTVIAYEPEIEALRSGEPRIVVAVGETSHETETPYQTAVALAGQLGLEPVVFPGDHGGLGTHAAEFADKLHAVLRG